MTWDMAYLGLVKSFDSRFPVLSAAFFSGDHITKSRQHPVAESTSSGTLWEKLLEAFGNSVCHKFNN